MFLQNVPQHLPGGGELNNQLLSRGRHIAHRRCATQLLVAPAVVPVHVMLILAGIQGSLLSSEQVVRRARCAAAAVERCVVVAVRVRTVRRMRRVSGVCGVVRHVSAAVVALLVLLV